MSETNCYKRRWGPYGKGGPACGRCQQCKDLAVAQKVASQHQYGRFCKGSDNNQCSICARIKWRVRRLFHLSGRCFKSCPFCPTKLCFADSLYTKDFYRFMFGLKETHGNLLTKS
jgi:hypothetical protein